MFSKATEYALRAVIYIALKSSEESRIGINELAKAIGSPKSFTAKILQKLSANNKVVSSVRGPGGGFYMTLQQKRLPVKAIPDVMGETTIFNNCVLGLKHCSEDSPCPMHTKYKSIKQELNNLFDSKTIQKLAYEISKGKSYIKIA